MLVKKRNGETEILNLDKLHKVVQWSTEGLTNVSSSQVEINSRLQFHDEITTDRIQETLIKSAANLISEECPNYQFVAGRLVNYHLRKQVYGQYTPTSLYALINKNIARGFYDQSLLDEYSESEWSDIESFIDHERDMRIPYAGMSQLRGKTLVQSRVTREIMETPQVAYALIAATLFGRLPRSIRMKEVRDYYNATSQYYISLPTPIMAGVRTPQRQFSSCVLIEAGDSLKSISAASTAILKYVSQKAGVGIGASAIRAKGSLVRKGDTSHTGVTPFYKLFEASVKSCSAGSIRNGAATLFYPIWHLEIEDMLVLRNVKGTPDNRVRLIDYGVQFTKIFYERFINDGVITLFSPHAVPEMYKAFFTDVQLFKKLYEEAELNPLLMKKTISAHALFGMFIVERKDTGRVYLQNVDNANTHSSFIEQLCPIRQSNLCMEISLPTREMGLTKVLSQTVLKTDFVKFLSDATANDQRLLQITAETSDDYTLDVEHDDSRIATCTLSAINWGLINDPSEFEHYGRLAVRALDELLDYQRYPVTAARLGTMEHRPLGIGIINLAYWLAKNGFKYSDDSSLPMLDEWAEAWSYYLIKASVDLAKEKGPCLNVHETKYHLGIMPIDTRKPAVDRIIAHVERMPWDDLRTAAKLHGIRNSTLMALMPAECQNWANPISLADATTPNFHELLESQGIDWALIEQLGVPQRYAFDKPIMVNTANGPKPAYEYYYNGAVENFEVEFSDGTIYTFSGNHMLKIIRNGKENWCRVDELQANDLTVAVS